MIHNKLLNLRIIERILSEKDFQIIFHKSSSGERSYIKTLIHYGEGLELKSWYTKKKKENLHALSIIELRRLASINYVHGYQSLCKSKLILILEEINGKRK